MVNSCFIFFGYETSAVIIACYMLVIFVAKSEAKTEDLKIGICSCLGLTELYYKTRQETWLWQELVSQHDATATMPHSMPQDQICHRSCGTLPHQIPHDLPQEILIALMLVVYDSL